MDGPAHELLPEDHPLRLRAVIGGRVVLAPTRARILHETGRPVVPYVPIEDLDGALLECTDTTTHCPSEGDASSSSVRVGDALREDAVGAYEQPLQPAAWLRGLAALAWDRADAWSVEEDRCFGPHLRDRVQRVDVRESARPVTVRAAGRVVARSPRLRLLAETSLPVRTSLPRAGVDAAVLVPSATRTTCPSKGEAASWSVQVDGRRFDDAAWVFETPLPEAQAVAGPVCLLGDRIEVEAGDPPGRMQAGPGGG